ncbi:MAG: hypothetical protein LC713_06120 [Actinobacteria bacterium]|nr:hypothetical protein [Actinomycetota bacterium]
MAELAADRRQDELANCGVEALAEGDAVCARLGHQPAKTPIGEIGRRQRAEQRAVLVGERDRIELKVARDR